MTKLLITAMCLLLSGCFYQKLDNTDIKKALHYCEGVENIKETVSTAFGDEYVLCTDGAWTHLGVVKLPRKTGESN